jgi:hypothetical protein
VKRIAFLEVGLVWLLAFSLPVAAQSLSQRTSASNQTAPQVSLPQASFTISPKGNFSLATSNVSNATPQKWYASVDWNTVSGCSSIIEVYDNVSHSSLFALRYGTTGDNVSSGCASLGDNGNEFHFTLPPGRHQLQFLLVNPQNTTETGDGYRLNATIYTMPYWFLGATYAGGYIPFLAVALFVGPLVLLLVKRDQSPSEKKLDE